MNYKFLGKNLDRNGYAYDLDHDEQAVRIVGTLFKENPECQEIKVCKYSGQSKPSLHLDATYSEYSEWRTFNKSEYIQVPYKSGNGFRLVHK